jgi:hypothetical protein
MNLRPYRLRARMLAPATVAVLLAACAAPRPDAEWTAPDVGAQASLLRRANVLVACEAPDVAVRNVCQDRLAAQVAARGGRPVFVPGETRLTPDRSLDEQLLPSARNANATAILVLSLRPVASEPTSGASFSIGGFGFGGRSAFGGGVSAPIGETRIATTYAANGRVTSVSTGRLVWTATTTTPAAEDLSEQLSTLSTSVLDSAARAGLF